MARRVVRSIASNGRSSPDSVQKCGHSDIRGGRSLWPGFWSL